MTQVPSSYCNRLSAWASDNKENLSWALIITGVALLAIGIGFLVANTLDIGQKAPDINPHSRSPISKCGVLALPASLGLVSGMVISFMGSMCLGIIHGKMSSKDFSYLKNVQLTLIVIGLAVALFGIGMATGATALHNSDAFSDPNNQAYYTKEAWEAIVNQLTTRTAIGFTLIPLIGGGIVAAGMLPSIPIKIADWFESRADAKRKADEATATGKINLNGEDG